MDASEDKSSVRDDEDCESAMFETFSLWRDGSIELLFSSISSNDDSIEVDDEVSLVPHLLLMERNELGDSNVWRGLIFSWCDDSTKHMVSFTCMFDSM